MGAANTSSEVSMGIPIKAHQMQPQRLKLKGEAESRVWMTGWCFVQAYFHREAESRVWMTGWCFVQAYFHPINIAILRDYPFCPKTREPFLTWPSCVPNFTRPVQQHITLKIAALQVLAEFLWDLWKLLRRP